MQKNGGIMRHRVAGCIKTDKSPKGSVWFESSYEEKFISACLAAQDVLSIKRPGFRIPYEFDGMTRFYVPDYVVTTDSEVQLVEVKPKRYQNHTRNKLKFAAGRKYAKEQGWVFKIADEDSINKPISSQADRKRKDVGRKVQRPTGEESQPINLTRAPQALIAILLTFLMSSMAMGHDMVRYSGEIRRAEINNSAITFDDMEANEAIPEIDLLLTSAPVTARPFKLRGRWSVESQQDFQAYHGISAEVELVKFMANEIQKNINYRIVAHIAQIAAAGVFAWSATPPAGVPWIWHKETLFDALISASNLIFSATQRRAGNWIVAGVGACNVIETLSKFKSGAGGAKDVAGIRKIGQLGDFTIFKDPNSARTAMIMGYKGGSFLDAGYVYAPYLGVYTTPPIVLDDFLARRGMMQRAGFKVINANMYCTGTITGASPAGL